MTTADRHPRHEQRNELVTQKLTRDHDDPLIAEMKEAREGSRAQREALLALIDRLPPVLA